MSGPKISVYQLDENGRRIYYGQLHCFQKYIQCARQIQKMLEGIPTDIEALRKNAILGELWAKRTGSADGSATAIQAIIEEISSFKQKLSNQYAIRQPVMPHKILLSEADLQKNEEGLSNLMELKKQLEQMCGELSQIPANDAKGTEQTAIKLEKDIAHTLGSVVSFELPEIDNADDRCIGEKTESLLKELNRLLETQGLTEQLYLEIKNAIAALLRLNTVEHLGAFEAVTLQDLRKKVKEQQAALEEEKQRYLDAHAIYVMLCGQLGVQPQEFPFDKGAADKLRAQIDELEHALFIQQEEEYVRQAIDEAMEKMGYEVIGTNVVKKKSGKRFDHHLYSFGEGKAVDITYSSDGQITMELGGITRENRIPSPEEASELANDMAAFCSEHEKFERLLREKGVVLGERIAHLPPDAAHAELININDYNLRSGYQVIEYGSDNTVRAGINGQRYMEID